MLLSFFSRAAVSVCADGIFPIESSSYCGAPTPLWDAGYGCLLGDIGGEASTPNAGCLPGSYWSGNGRAYMLEPTLKASGRLLGKSS